MFGQKKKVKEPAKPEVRACMLNHQIQQVGDKTIMRVNCIDCYANASLGNPACMEGLSKTLGKTQDGVTEIVLLKSYNKIFQEKDINLLKEVEEVAKNLDIKKFCEACSEAVSQLRGDPVYVYYKLKEKECRKCQSFSKPLIEQLGKTTLVSQIITSKGVGYKDIFVPHLIPDIVCSFVDQKNPETKPEASYEVDNVQISIHPITGRPDMLYFARFPELSLKKEDVEIIKNVIKELAGQKKNIDLSPEKVRGDFRRHISAILDSKAKGSEKLALEKIILRHTIGYGVIEPLLLDERVQDVYVDSGSPQVHIVHQDFGECITNIYITNEEIEKLSTRLRALSKRPLDASSPVLHTELEDLGVRVCGICEPSTYKGTGFAFRKRKPVPWTLAELVDAKMLNSEAAGFLSYLAENQNSILITGPRSSGKTSLL
ncbi:MAG TPA: ATPase, T2SS/T4P/T4SS family, partial [archaeon]|nr:ATPase, T2SS/T4P/T4SS family [archaeon]